MFISGRSASPRYSSGPKGCEGARRGSNGYGFVAIKATGSGACSPTSVLLSLLRRPALTARTKRTLKRTWGPRVRAGDA